MGDGEDLIREVWGRWNSGARERVAEIDEQFEAWDISIDEIDPQSPTRFVTRGAIRTRGRHSGIDLDQPVTWTVAVRDGRILRLTNTLGADE
jgi:ketosteroid isomerase-like protein